MKIVWGEVSSLFSSVRSISFSLFPEFYKINMLWKKPLKLRRGKRTYKRKKQQYFIRFVTVWRNLSGLVTFMDVNVFGRLSVTMAEP